MTPFLPPLIPNETASSYASHVLMLDTASPHSLASEGPMIGGPVIHSVAVSLEKLCALTAGCLGTPQVLLVENTLFPYYSSTCDYETREQLARRLIAGPSSHLRLPRLHAPVELERTGHQYCPVCREEELREFGRFGQLTFHVLPLVQTCGKHDDVLRDDAGGRDRRALEYPSRVRCNAARLFARTSCQLMELKTPEAAAMFRDSLREMLMANSFVRPDGRLYASRLDEAMAAYYSHSAFDGRLKCLASGVQRASRTVHALDSGRCQHPVLLILLAMLLADADVSTRFASRKGAAGECSKPMNEPQVPKCTGKPRARCTTYGRKIRELLEKGFSPRQTAGLLHIRVDRVYYQIRRDGLREGITELRLERERPKQRRAWLAALQRWPGRTTNFVRSQVPKVHRWLYRNDGAWLQQNGSGVHTWTCVGKWHGRRPYGADAKLAARILEMGKATRAHTPATRCSRRHLVVNSGLTEQSFRNALRWKHVARAVAEAVESVTAFRARVRTSRN